ncbi:MAG: hypothetical protein CMM72_05720, partial [Rhodospirillaceae bacterium]|nr:hypothetical protein [Rhodospirillaceae bacterium]
MDIWVLILPLVRVILYIGMMLVNGSIFYGLLLGAQMTAGSKAHLAGLVRAGALVGLAAVAVQIPASAGYLGGDVASAFDPLYLRLMLETTLGWSSLLAAAGFIMAVWLPRLAVKYHIPTGGLICLLIASAFAVHGHATTGGMVTRLLLVIHLACVAVWLGAFLPLHRLCRLATDDPVALLELAQTGRRFAQVGSITVALLLVSGGILAVFLTGSVTAMVATDYGLALSGKVILVSGLLGLAALNRYRLVPAVDSGERAAAARL